ncbi:hypothetical protein FZC66_13980 [Priestia megaterium]|nr:hypothetical protein FZC66_13980 [Priestia megaterium]
MSKRLKAVIVALELNVAPKDCIAIEDGAAGLQGIKQTDMFSIGIGDHEEMKAADWHVSSTQELVFEEMKKRFNQRKCPSFY